MKPVFFHPAAQAEFFAAQDFYEARVEGLGEDFRQEVLAAVDVVRASPQRWPVRIWGARTYFVYRFPFAVVYLEMPKKLWVVAVAHTSRRPGYWKGRL
ncbi:MAG: type II toxin-antitoxin system RelE/ParE family toxin [Verrucomicrobiia bacterium]